MNPFKKNQDNDYLMYEADGDHEEPEEPSLMDRYREEDMDELEYYNEAYRDYHEQRSIQLSSKAVLLFSFYILFLIMGAFSTSFVTSDTGGREAQIVSIALREERSHYYEVRDHYIANRTLMQEIQYINRRREGATEEQYFNLATEYSSLLPIINENLPKARGMSIGHRYQNVHEQTVNMYDLTAVYLQKISSALSNQSIAELEDALEWEQRMFMEFERYENNMRNFAEMVKLEDDIYQQKTVQSHEIPSAAESETLPGIDDIPKAGDQEEDQEEPPEEPFDI